MMPYYYVFKPTGSAPKVRHDTLAEAQEEAERLATREGAAIEILKCVGIASCSKASTFWMDGEGPEPGGTRYFVGLTGHTAWRQRQGARLEVTNQDSRHWVESVYLNCSALGAGLSGVREITAAELPERIEP
jgi:hypothetical protein